MDCLRRCLGSTAVACVFAAAMVGCSEFGGAAEEAPPAQDRITEAIDSARRSGADVQAEEYLSPSVIEATSGWRVVVENQRHEVYWYSPAAQGSAWLARFRDNPAAMGQPAEIVAGVFLISPPFADTAAAQAFASALSGVVEEGGDP